MKRLLLVLGVVAGTLSLPTAQTRPRPVFAFGTGSHAGEVNMTVSGALGAEMMADAILRAVREATGVPGYPAVRDLRRP